MYGGRVVCCQAFAVRRPDREPHRRGFAESACRFVWHTVECYFVAWVAHQRFCVARLQMLLLRIAGLLCGNLFSFLIHDRLLLVREVQKACNLTLSTRWSNHSIPNSK